MLNVYRQGQPNWEAIVLGEKLQRKSEIAHYFVGSGPSRSGNRQPGLHLFARQRAGMGWPSAGS